MRLSIFESIYDDVYGDYDYKTGDIVDDNVIDMTKQSGGFIDEFSTPKKRQDEIDKHNRFGRIVMMSPKEYYKACADMFDVSVDRLMYSRGVVDRDKIEALKEVLLDKKKKFPMPYIDVTNNDYSKGKWQEGLHRMYAIGEVYGWDKKVPVFSVSYYSKRRNNKERKNYEIWQQQKKLNSAVNEALTYQYGLEYIDEYTPSVADMLKDEIESKLNQYIYPNDSDYIPLTVEEYNKDTYRVLETNNPKIRVYIKKEDIHYTLNDKPITIGEIRQKGISEVYDGSDAHRHTYSDDINDIEALPDDIPDDDLFSYLFKESYKRKKNKNKNQMVILPDPQKSIDFFNHAVGADGSNQPMSVTEAYNETDIVTMITKYLVANDFIVDDSDEKEIFIVTPNNVQLRMTKGRNDTYYISKSGLFRSSYPYDVVLRNIDKAKEWIVDIVDYESS